MFTCIRNTCCRRVPKSTESEYYFDPKVMTTGAVNFQSSRTLDIVSRLEFEEIRTEMIKVGAKDLQLAKILYHAIKYYGTMCIIWWIVYLGWGLSSHKFKGIGVTLTLIMTIVPNIIAVHLWKMYMGKASENIQRMFDRQNLASYNIRGIHWGTRRTLLYIYIRIFDQQLRNTGQFLANGGQTMYQTPGSSGFASPGEGRGLISHQATGQHRSSIAFQQQNATMIGSQTEGFTPLHHRNMQRDFSAPPLEYQISNPQSDYPTAPQQTEYNPAGYQPVSSQGDYQMVVHSQISKYQVPENNDYQMAPSQLIKYEGPQMTDSQFIRSQVAPQKTEFRALQVYQQRMENQAFQQSEFGHIQIYPKIELQATNDIQIEMPPAGLEVAKKIGMEVSNKPATEQTFLEKTGLEKTGLELSKQTALGISKQNQGIDTALGISKQTVNETLKDLEDPPVIPAEAKVQIPTSPDLLKVPKKRQKGPNTSASRVEPSSNLFSEENSIEDPSKIELQFPEEP